MNELAITRKISAANKALVAPIDYVYGETAVDIVITVTDYTIPTGATAAVYASVPGGSVYTQTATISGNDITISPVSGLFQPGKNDMQVEITASGKKLITFAVTVNCENQLSENGSASASSVRTSAQIDADVSQIKEDIGALDDLTTTDKSSLVAAINEAAASGGGTSGAGWTSAQITLLETVLQNLAYSSASTGQTAASSLISSLRGNSGGSSDSGGSSSGGTDTPDTPTTPTLSSISVSYYGGSVDAGTATSSLSITVTATYSDSSTQAVTSGYTLYPTEIAEGSNTVTVTYQGKNASFTVTGNSAASADDGSGWEDGVAYADLGLTGNSEINTTDGSVKTPSSGWSCTTFLPCKNASTIGSLGNAYSSKYGAWYDADKNFISAWNDTMSISNATSEFFISVPSSACWFRWSTTTASFERDYFKLIPHA